VRVLVTGGAGFIGSHLCDALLDRGARVTVLDNLSTGRRENLADGVELVHADVRDREAVRRVVRDGRPDAVCHLAAQASVWSSFDEPERDLAVNVGGTLNVLEECLAARVPRLLHASSMTVYGDAPSVPTPETAPCRPISHYGVTKYAGECYVRIAGTRPGTSIAVTSFRMYNVYGERQRLDNPYQGVLAIFAGNVLRGEPITIHSDGEQTRDFVYVDDAVAAWLAALDDTPATRGGVFNVATGRATSVNELAAAVLATLDKAWDDWDVRHAPAQAGDVRHARADVSALERAVGWRARIELADGLARTLQWARAAALS
jgi:UDP-glucose 4-epimerase